MIYAPKNFFSSIGQTVLEIQSSEKLHFRGLSFVELLVKNSLKIDGSIFFESACVKIHKTVASTTYLKLSKIGGHRLSALGRGFRGLAHKSGRTAYGDEPFYASSSLTEPYLRAKYQLDRRVAPGDVPSLVRV